MTTWTVPAVVFEVIDGDSVRLELDLGWRVYRRDPCRLVGINAPELHGADRLLGLAARDALAGLLPVGERVTFVSHALDKYGRPLGQVLLADGTDVGQSQLAAGHAVPYSGGPR
jgi:endonuclease YncB( thermonuclease family)